MPCYHPLTAWIARRDSFHPSGKPRYVFNHDKGLPHTEVKLKCGQCAGCRLDRSVQWATRCMYEASLHSENCFLTLTYNDENLPSDGSLQRDAVPLFMKRLRKALHPKKVKVFYAGEYGDPSKSFRPHYHLCLFNHFFSDSDLYSCKSAKISGRLESYRLYTSKKLAALWPFGFSTLGDLTFESAAYVARYCMKKITGQYADEYYQGKLPPFAHMSRRPGLAYDWFQKYKDDLYNHDQCVVRPNLITKPAKYFDAMFELIDPDRMAEIKLDRKNAALNNPDNTHERLEVREKIKKLKLQQLTRNL